MTNLPTIKDRKAEVILEMIDTGFAICNIIKSEKTDEIVDFRITGFNKACCSVTGYSEDELKDWYGSVYVGQKRMSFFLPIINKLMSGGETLESLESEIVSSKNGRVLQIRFNKIDDDEFIVFFKDVTEIKESKLFTLISYRTLEILNSEATLKEMMQHLVDEIRKNTGCDAVGLRLEEENDFTYFVHSGFSDEFIKAENSLLIKDKNGKIIMSNCPCSSCSSDAKLSCTCGLVLSGTMDSNHPFFTENGSFWTNDSGPIADIPESNDPRIKPRNFCIHSGYNSFALIPVRVSGKIIGLLQLNAFTKGMFSKRTIVLMEDIAAHIGEALQLRKVEQELKIRNVFLDRLLNTIPIPVFYKDIDGRYIGINHAFTELLGIKEEDIIGRTVHDISTPEMAEIYRKQDEELYQSPDKIQIYDFQVKRTDGKLRDVVFHKATLVNDVGELTGLIGAVMDISDIKHAEKDLREKNNQLEETLRMANELSEAAESGDRVKADFLANVSHELRTPLNGIIGVLNLLMDSSMDDKRKELVELAANNSSSLLRLINDILDYSKIEAGKMELLRAEFKLSDLFQEVKNTLIHSASGKGLNLRLHISDDIPDIVYGDSGRIRQILLNLAFNAVKFTNEGTVEIAVEIEKNDVLPPVMKKIGDEIYSNSIPIRFSVKDTGIGIPEDKINELFVKFNQLDNALQRSYGGTGLGLAISRSLVDIMGGIIGVRSAFGEGSEFWFSLRLHLPDNDTENGQIKTETEDVIADNGPFTDFAQIRNIFAKSKARILLAEDNKANIAVAKGMIKKLGLELEVATNGREAIEALRSKHYDLVLMDVQMPEMDGFEATSIIRDKSSSVRNHDIPVVAMTAHAMKGDRELCVQAGMNDYVSKPVSPLELARVLSRYINVTAKE